MCCHASRVSGSVKPVSTAVQAAPSSISHRLIWFSANGRRILSHKTPGAIGMTSPGAGASATGNSNGPSISTLFIFC